MVGDHVSQSQAIENLGSQFSASHVTGSQNFETRCREMLGFFMCAGLTQGWPSAGSSVFCKRSVEVDVKSRTFRNLQRYDWKGQVTSISGAIQYR